MSFTAPANHKIAIPGAGLADHASDTTGEILHPNGGSVING
jgi:hypothetical protein